MGVLGPKAINRRAARAWEQANPEIRAQGFRFCATCHKVAPEAVDFVRDSRCQGGFRNQCRSCHQESRERCNAKHPERQAEAAHKWRQENPEKNKASRLAYNQNHPERIKSLRRANRMRKYGLAPEEYEAHFTRQGGLCGICGDPPNGRWKNRLHVDHDHATGAVRGLICVGCNRAIGYLNDDPQRAKRVADYLEHGIGGVGGKRT